ncbi:MAG: metallophosphoesterase [Comamonas sp.]
MSAWPDPIPSVASVESVEHAVQQAAPGAPCRILHLSDPHFGTERADVMAALEAFVARARPTLMVLSGDLTQRAQASQYRAARRFIDRLQQRCGAPWVAIAGNHDIPLFNLAARLAWPLRQYRASICADLEPEYADSCALVLCVNTVRRWRHKDGAVSRAQIERVAQRLQRAAPGQLRVVVTHQPVHVIEPRERENLLIGHAEAVRRWAQAGADLILGGHIHSAYVRPLGASPAGVLPQSWAVQAGTAVSSRVRREQPNSVNLICYRPAGPRAADGRMLPAALAVQQWDYRRDAHAAHPVGDFVRVLETPLLAPDTLAAP